MFKESIFNIAINHPKNSKKIFLWNTFTKSMIIFDKNYYNTVIKNINNTDFVISDDLIKNGFIINENINERELVIKKLFSYNKSILSPNYIITMTPNCNSSCEYCFSSKLTYINKNIYINSETIDDILLFIRDIIDENNINELSIQLYGGEPLLNIDKIEEICKKSRSHIQRLSA